MSSTASSAVFFIESDVEEANQHNADGEDSPTTESVSFHEDMISLTYHALLPQRTSASATQSVQFDTDEENDAEDTTMEFDSISFATTTDIAPMRQERHSTPSSVATTPQKAAAEAHAREPRKKATAVSDPVANMTVRQRFEYYQARGNQKKVQEAAAATRSGLGLPPAAARPPPPAASPIRETTKAAGLSRTLPTPSVAASSTSDSTRCKAKKSEGLAKRICASSPATTSALPADPATTLANEREVQLAALVQRLQEDVRNLLAQSHTDATRIAAMRGVLAETQRDYRALRAAHCSSLNQLNAYAMQIASSELPDPLQQQQEQQQEEEEEEQQNDGDDAPVADADTVEKDEGAARTLSVEDAEQKIHEDAAATAVNEPEAVQASQATTEEEIGEEFQEQVKVFADPITADAPEEVAADERDAAAVELDVAFADAVEAPEHVENDNTQVPALDVNAAEAINTPTSVASVEAAAAAMPAASKSCVAPIPALHHLSETEVRALLKQLGYIHHNRLLRRENALLMHHVRLLTEETAMAKPKKGAAGPGGARRLNVVVRIRPVGLTGVTPAATTAEQPPCTTPAALTSPGTNSVRSSSARAMSPLERHVGDGGGTNTLAASSVFSPLLSAKSFSLTMKEQSTPAVAAATAVPPAAPADVLLHCDFTENRLQVRNPELLASTRDQGATVRGVRIIGPPLPQSLASLPSPSSSSLLSHRLGTSVSPRSPTTADSAGDDSVSALRVAAAIQQRRLYEETVAPLVVKALRGESCTVLSYGQVGSGKTYTMFGDGAAAAAAATDVGEGERTTHRSAPTVLGELPEEAGVVPRAIVDLFDHLRDHAASEELLLRSLYASRHDASFHAALGAQDKDATTTAAAAASTSEASAAALVALSRVPMYEVQCSMVELYGEKVRDLLADKIKVPIYEEFMFASSGVKGSAGYRSSSAERRLQLQLRQAQAAQQRQQKCTTPAERQGRHRAEEKEEEEAAANEQRRIIGFERVTPECALHASEDGGARVVGATQVTLCNADEAMKLIARGLRNRETHATASNARSSRSHVMLTLTLRQQQWLCEAAPPSSSSLPEVAGKKSEKHDKKSMGAAVSAAPSTQAKSTAKTAKAKGSVAKRRKVKGTSASGGSTKTKAKTKAPGGDAGADAAAVGRLAPSRPENTQTPFHAREESAGTMATTAAEVEEQEHRAQDRYLQRRTVKSITSRLVFVDLAGTDRGVGQVTTGDPDRLREAQAIGRSLSALGDVMSVLYGGSGVSAAHVPFRSHKLTMLLRDALVKPTTCVMLACIALSEAPMAALLADAGTSMYTEASSHSVRSSSTTAQTAPTAEQQYWRLATERFLAMQRAKAAAPKRGGDPLAASVRSAFSPHAWGDSSSRQASTRLSAKRRKSASKSVTPSSRRFSASLIDAHGTSPTSDDADVAGRRSGTLLTRSPVVQHLDASTHTTASVPGRSGASQKRQQPEQQEPSVDPDLAAQFHAIQANAEAEDSAAAEALWITPRETLSTLVFLSRLWKG